MKRFIKILIGTLFSLVIIFIAMWLMRDRIFLAIYSDSTLKYTEQYENAASGKSVIVMPVYPINSSEHYALSRNYLDSMKHIGYVTLSTGILEDCHLSDTVGYTTVHDALASKLSDCREDLQELRLKYRKVSGMPHIDWSNDSMRYINQSIPKSYRSNKYRGRSFDLLGTTSDQDYWIDYTLADLIHNYEDAFGEIILSDTDRSTPICGKYKEKRSEDQTIFMSWRSNYFCKKIIDSKFDKMIVICDVRYKLLICACLLDHGFKLDYHFNPTH